jgi:heme/copper-type cytochrome/quinol oxidase subunit 4
MSESHQPKTTAAHAAVDEHPVDYNSYVRRCAYIFVAVLCAVAAMIYISYLPHYSWAAKVTMILAVASVNAFLVAGFLMHLLSEKKLIYTVLGFTVFFFAGLLGLTLYAMQDFPTGTQMH